MLGVKASVEFISSEQLEVNAFLESSAPGLQTRNDIVIICSLKISEVSRIEVGQLVRRKSENPAYLDDLKLPGREELSILRRNLGGLPRNALLE